MIKKQKVKQTQLQKNPYLYYVTNWGFVNPTTTETPSETKKR
ncbi:hypothetical protein HMPREF0765_0917 [Sphingobacterium spiritivorum ATCC 33300]|uniref:Uncharacterized protein n=2 Tax=Sphingobacterium spiritivorum TaxID=258 RepID=D7VRN6_SPHSI|nr:hypothetical protein HMPREF0765_0917 [Sphingobacterium spiritivorum ATCC 33300]EFK56437.1 hypothetical protein HMPREF0766_13640 [Sphingobacterium spiritivorum ATCC 33861]SUJ06402.1 Uncharacterised protein [Sphingobacterium spiritivorum]